MKKTFIFGLIAAALGFTACSSEEDLNVNNENNQKGMVLRATVEQPAESRAFISDDWDFDFIEYDEIKMTNSEIGYDNFYTFENDGTYFVSEDAKATKTDATWYAYYPSDEVYFIGKVGIMEEIAYFYALAGTTTTTGKNGLNISMKPHVAILVIDNQKGAIDINVKNSADTWVYGMKANAGGFDVLDDTEKISLLKQNKTGTYYVVVPAGVQLAIKDGDKVIASTSEKGLKAGRYYELTIAAPTTGKAYATGPNCDVNWVQLWEGGPKFAEYNVGAANNKAEDYGGYYCWGKTTDQDSGAEYNEGSVALSGDDDTATNLWGEKWRMPTQAELESLLNSNNCTCTWTDNYNETGVQGWLCTGKEGTAYENNSVFLPAAGDCCYGDVLGQGEYGSYWSSTPYDIYTAYYLNFFSYDQGVLNCSRGFGFSVRAVLK